MSISDRAAQLVAARTPFVRATVVREIGRAHV